METKKMKTLDMVYIALFACLMAICAWISIPGQIPFTLQTMGVFLAVGLLGGKRGTLTVLVYILMGAVGLPVFSGMSGGIGKLLGMTGGYIVGFLFSALIMWAMEALLGKKLWVLALSMVAGLIVVPVVSLITPKMKKERLDEIFACYQTETVLHKKLVVGSEKDNED